MHISLMMG